MRASRRDVRCQRWTWVVLVAVACGRPAHAADSTSVALPVLEQRDLSGPRVGVLYRPTGDTRQVGRFVSMFGWHVESQVGTAGGPQFIVEFVPLVAGVEYGKFYPSLSLGFGVRLPSGFEFGVGPTVSVGGRTTAQEVGLRSAVFGTVGRTFDYGGVKIPVNLVVSGNRDGSRMSLVVGYAIKRAERTVEPLTAKP